MGQSFLFQNVWQEMYRIQVMCIYHTSVLGFVPGCCQLVWRQPVDQHSFFFFFNWDWLFWRMLAFPRDFSLQLTEMSFELHHRQLSFYCILWVVSVSVCSLVLFCFLFFRNVLKQFYALLLSHDWQCRLLITVFVPVIYVQS